MNIPYLSLKNIVSRPLSTFLSWLLLSFGVTIIVLILLAADQLKQEINKNAQGIDMVVGAKGSPLQLILCSIFHADFPTGNISLSQANALSRNRYIAEAIPMSLGDSYEGFRIVGTTKAYADKYNMNLAQGQWYTDEMQAVIGSEVAKKLGLKLGDEFASQHGMSDDGDAHEGHPFKVVGIFEPSGTVLDQLLLVDLQSIWHVHEHEEEEGAHEGHAHEPIELKRLGVTVTDEQLEEAEITTLLIKYKSPMAAVMLPRIVNDMPDLQAASPAFETARLFNIIGVGIDVMNLLGLMIIVISAVSVFVALLHSLKDRKYDIAIMRSMGATRWQIFLNVLLEGLWVTFVGCISGLVFAHVAIGVLTTYIEGVAFDWTYFSVQELWVIAGGLVIGVISSLIPAFMAYKTDISKTLSKG